MVSTRTNPIHSKPWLSVYPAYGSAYIATDPIQSDRIQSDRIQSTAARAVDVKLDVKFGLSMATNHIPFDKILSTVSVAVDVNNIAV